jgi:uncharacterized protein (TIGR02996 family)
VQPALIARIVADPGDASAWLAYRDWLLERGDPRGVWIAEATDTGDDAVAKRPPVAEDQLVSPRLAAQVHLLQLGWWRGFLRTAALTGAMDDPPTHETIRALFADPHAGLLSELALRHPIAETVPLWQALVEEPRPSLKQLTANSLGASAAQLANLPNLETLELVASGVRYGQSSGSPAPVEVLDHPRLRRLAMERHTCPAVCRGTYDLPALESLEWAAGELDMATLRDDELELFTSSESILHRPPAALDTLALDTRYTAIEPLAVLERCAVLRQLRRLSLRPAHLADLVARAASYQHLEVFTCLGTDSLQPAEVAALRHEVERALPRTRFEVDWAGLVARERVVHAAPTERVDAQSRDRTGRINAFLRYSQRDDD